MSPHEEDWKVNGYRCYTVEQKKGDLVIVWPGAYHSGFNLGYNLAEAVSFAQYNWLNIGLAQPVCDPNCKIGPSFTLEVEGIVARNNSEKIAAPRLSRKK